MAESMETMDEQTVEEMKSTYKSSGASGLLSAIKDKLNFWKTKRLNIAIIGNSGAGKSTYINAIRELDADDEGAAAVGETETTVGDPISYKDPRNSNLLYWDLPGVGTPKYPRAKYLRQIGFEKYDFYILISSQRFTENDLWLAQQIEEAGKKFFFLRSKIDNALDNEKKAHRKTYNREATLDKIRGNCMDELRKGGIKTVHVFLIDNYQPALFDFEKAKEQLLEEFPTVKKDAVVLSLTFNQSRAILKEKTGVLRERISNVGLAACLKHGSIIPGLGIACDIHLICSETDFYASQLALDDSSLKTLASMADIPESALTKKRRLYDAGEIFDKLKNRRGTVRTFLSFIPLIGTIANLDAASIIREILTDILNEYEAAAIDILESTRSIIIMKADDDMDI